RSAILAAKAANMPNDNIDRAIKRGSGELESLAVEEIVYEGYAPGGVALMIEAATDNKNRTAADIRSAMAKNHGSLGVPGCVAYMFHRKGQLILPAASISEDELFEIAIEAGAEDLTCEDEHHIITTPPDHLYQVAEALKASGHDPESQKLTFIPENTVTVPDDEIAWQVIRLCDALDDVDDVMNVHANFDIPEEVLSKLDAA
ncbi:MAG: YebC/PmpR family DNA-binding transcriptional regulator, partial [Chthoniobacterales bacterium]